MPVNAGCRVEFSDRLNGKCSNPQNPGNPVLNWQEVRTGGRGSFQSERTAKLSTRRNPIQNGISGIKRDSSQARNFKFSKCDAAALKDFFESNWDIPFQVIIAWAERAPGRVSFAYFTGVTTNSALFRCFTSMRTFVSSPSCSRV